MDYFANIVRRLSRVGMAVGAAFLVGMMVLIVGNVFYRLAGHIIAGSYELSELMAVIVAVFALGYTALGKGHIIIDILVPRLSQQTQTVLAAFTSFICLCTWAVIAWASFGILSERWLTEETRMLSVPFLPFRFVWVFGLILLCLIYLIDLFTALRKGIRK